SAALMPGSYCVTSGAGCVPDRDRPPPVMFRGPARGPLASGPGMAVPPVELMTWGVVPPGPRGAAGDADERSGHRPAERNARPLAVRCGKGDPAVRAVAAVVSAHIAAGFPGHGTSTDRPVHLRRSRRHPWAVRGAARLPLVRP